MQEDRRFLRALLSALIAERQDAQGLYVPRGEAGIRRMIRALLAMRPAPEGGDPLAGDIARFEIDPALARGLERCYLEKTPETDI